MMEGWIGASFNALNQPVAMYSGSTPPGQFLWFGYDPLGRCVKRWLAPDDGESPEPEGGYAPGAQNPVATYLYYDGWNLVQEGTAPNSPTRLYVHGGRVDEVVAQIKPENNQLRYFQYDARGHCTFQTGTTGQIEEQYEYDAFGLPYFYDRLGNPTTTANGQPGSLWGNRILFTGREYLSDMRIYDFRHRVYHPELGRFLQPDPKHFAAGDYNLYRYCHNDPVNKIDPFGLLTYRFSKDFPETGPGGRKAIERAIEKELNRSKKGREILAADGVATIRPVNREHPKTVTRYSLTDNNFDVYFNPKDSRFQDPATFRALSKHRGELPEDSDKGRAVIIGHEFAHGVFKALDEHDGGRNIRDNENAIRRELGLPLRRSDGGTQFRTNE